MEKNYFKLMEECKAQGNHPISYSQISLYNNCPTAYKIGYIDKIKVEDDTNINLLFGNAMHNTVQFYLQELYKNEKIGNNLDLNNILFKYMASDLSKLKDKTVIPKKDFTQYLHEGMELLDYIKANQKTLFDTKKTKLLSIEEPVNITLPGTKLNLIGFVDLKLQDIETGEIIVIDLKTARTSWNDFKQKDINTVAQLLIYNHLLSIKTKTPIEKFKPKFMILMRQPYNKKYVQIVEPAHGTGKYGEMKKYVDNFVTNVFTEDAKFKTDGEFKFAEKDYTCTYCKYKGSKYCPKYPLDSKHKLNQEKITKLITDDNTDI